jgi:hypothetical protein
VKVLDAYPVLTKCFCGLREEDGGHYCSSDCPLRNHSTARCRFWLGTDGRLMFGCWRNCPKLEILRAVGLKWKDTFPDGADLTHLRQDVVARYPYRDEAGRLLYEKVRLEPGFKGTDKTFLLRRPDPTWRDGWTWKLGDVRRVLYRLPELLAAPLDAPVYVVAGEKDVWSLTALGLVATTNDMESAPWRDSYSAALTGRHVIIIEDADLPGARHANEVAGSLLTTCVSLRRSGLPAKDATAFLNGLRRSGTTDPHVLRHELAAALAHTLIWIGL